MPTAPRTDHTELLLLRGVNVGGHAKVPMASLRRFAEEAGATDVTTYLNSGNVLFRLPAGPGSGPGPGSAPERDDDAERTWLAAEVSGALTRELGLSIPVTALSRRELVTALELLDDLPFRGGEPKLTHLFVLANAAGAGAAARRLESFDAGEDQCKVIGRFVWVRYAQASYSSPLNLQRVEKTLGTTATARNLTTIRHLAGQS
ncbi:DUF1697 domain-containing protein [Citricoccus sp. GCM10030269]|uniref:DUF1697 domain-containing protein n=1 Tax=Citricoccus sp. GCM10030269 TaxID=3273388 RepID=UPI00361C7F1B